jgi:30S ribosomal protein S31
MGKGDKKTKKGKIWIGSFGVSRPKKAKNKKTMPQNTGVMQEKTEKPPKKAGKKK